MLEHFLDLETSNPVFLAKIRATSGSSRCPISSATQLPASSAAEAMFSLSSYRSRAVRNGEMPRIAATSLPPIPRLRYASHSCSVRFSVLTSTLVPAVCVPASSAPPLALAIGALGPGAHMVQPIPQIARDGSYLARACDAPCDCFGSCLLVHLAFPPFLYKMYFSKPIGLETK